MSASSRGAYEARDVAALLAHVVAALAVVDRMNARSAGSITFETRRELAFITSECDDLLDVLLASHSSDSGSSS